MQQQGPNPGFLKPSKLIPLDEDMHRGDKAKALPFFSFPTLFLTSVHLLFQETKSQTGLR